MTIAPATRRINRGRGHAYTLDGAPVPGVTTIIGQGMPKPALVDWAGRVAAGYAIDHWDELADLGVAERLRRIERARYEQVGEAAVRGSAVHALAEQLAAGAELDVPEPLLGHVDAYLRFAEEWQPRELHVEAPVFSREFMYGGTVDLVADLADGNRWLLDWKTAKSGVFQENALQLAAYRYADIVLADAGDGGLAEQPMPPVDRTGVVWLRADGYDLVPVRADADAFVVFGHVQQVAGFARSDRDEWIADALPPPAPREEDAA
jgi:hypothetical protein